MRWSSTSFVELTDCRGGKGHRAQAPGQELQDAAATVYRASTTLAEERLIDALRACVASLVFDLDSE